MLYLQEVDTAILASTFIFYSKAAKQSFLFIEIGSKGKGEQLPNITWKIFTDFLKFYLT